jgi:hypothetical protein
MPITPLTVGQCMNNPVTPGQSLFYASDINGGNYWAVQRCYLNTTQDRINYYVGNFSNGSQSSAGYQDICKSETFIFNQVYSTAGNISSNPVTISIKTDGCSDPKIVKGWS